ncbi:protein FAR-RED ELONGATED HYPOCOTYL 3-like [Rhizophagus irregularis DAOM 181602=DAOM 197198]|nr:protein FAR-RED ELONGATED HYPOCOTYL 3-like [Rhizophagus irregularis DAOM 181602=DAOM 197198]CAB5181634.1 unnamed protein product [Rhizophagus irregularis]
MFITDADPALDAAIPIVFSETYPAHSKDYLLHTLDQNCKLWAQAYLYKIFTTGIKSTARVKGYNWIIKQQLKAKSTLCEFANRLDSRLKEEKR